MNFKEHKTAGLISSAVCASGVFYLTTNIIVSVASGAVCFAGSLVPDIDTDSKPSKITALILSIACFFVIFQNDVLYHFTNFRLNPNILLSILGIFCMVKASKHRVFTHKYFLPVLFMAAGVLFGSFWMVSFAIGLIVHYLVDSIYPHKIKSWF